MRVLLIEDDSATAQSIELMLKSESFNVYTTDLGEEGVDLGKLYGYDIILLDLNLPDMSGYEVLRTLRLSKIKTPILILSGMAGVLIVAFQADVSALIPLYAVGVFVGFTLSQGGMVRHHLRLKEEGWRKSLAINLLGCVMTGIVLIVVGLLVGPGGVSMINV